MSKIDNPPVANSEPLPVAANKYSPSAEIFIPIKRT